MTKLTVKSEKTLANYHYEDGEVMTAAYGALLQDRLSEAPERVPPSIEVKLRAVVRTKDGYRLASRGSVGGVPKFDNQRATRRWRQLHGGALLDSFARGEDAWLNAPDLEVWEALLAAAEKHAVTGNELRKLNEVVAQLVALRAGLVVEPDSLPTVTAVTVEPVEDGEA